MSWPHRFTEYMRSDPSAWTAEYLSPLTTNELQALCQLMGIAHSGTKEQSISRLLDAADLRTVLAKATSVDDLMYLKGKELRDMCRRAGCFLGVNKRSSAASILNWRNKCRTAGQKALRAAQEKVAVKTVAQPALPFGKEE